MTGEEPRASLQVLLVEDNPGDVQLVADALDALDGGLHLRRVGRLDDALDAIAQAPTDVVLLDLGLPDSDGLTTLERLVTAAPQMPVVVMTGSVDRDLGAKALRAGAQDYLVKGEVDAGLLVRTLRFAVERHALVRGLRANLADESDRRAQLGRLEEVRRGLLAAAAHDVRSPVTVIDGLAQLTASHWDQLADERRLEHIRALARQSGRLAQLVDDLFSLVQVESGGLSTDRRAVDLLSTIDAVVDSTGVDVASVVVDCPAELTAEADRVHVQRMLANLLSNAQRYGAPPFEISGRHDGDEVLVNVLDHGPGVPDGLADGVFEQFTRGTESAPQALGLGLAIVDALARANGGSIRLLPSRDGAGACFRLHLPAATRPS